MKSLIVAVILASFCIPLQASVVRKQYIEVELISEVVSIQAGVPFWIAFRMKPDDGWHTYWKNPGDSGLPPTFEWSLPEKTRISGAYWPYPEVVDSSSIISYGYFSERLLIFQVTPPADLNARQKFKIKTKASWAVCKEICIAENTPLILTLPVKQTPAILDPKNIDRFKNTRQQLPKNKERWKSTYSVKNKLVTIELKGVDSSITANSTIGFFPSQADIIDHSAPQKVEISTQMLSISQNQSLYFLKPPNTLTGVLLVKEPGKTVAVEINAEHAGINP